MSKPPGTEPRNNGPRLYIGPAKAVGDRELDDELFRLLSAMCMFTNKEGFTWISLSRLAQELPYQTEPLSASTISRRIQKLVELGYITAYPRYDKKTGARLSNYWQVRLDFDPEAEPDVVIGTPLARGREPL